MSRDYIPREWSHGRPAWDRAKSLIRDYDRLLRERQDILYVGRRPPDNMPKGTSVSNPTENKAIRLVRISEDIEAVDQASVEARGWLSGKVRDDFKPVRAFWSYDYYNYQHIRVNEDDYGPSVRTWNRYKLAFIAVVAQKAKII